jgi:hypothetical protein
MDEEIATLSTLCRGFKNIDVKLIDAIVRYPVAYLKDGAIEMRDRYPIGPQEAPHH